MGFMGRTLISSQVREGEAPAESVFALATATRNADGITNLDEGRNNRPGLQDYAKRLR